MISITLCVISIAVNVLLVWYIRQLLRRFVYMDQNSERIITKISEFETHLRDVYGMETFYGDQTLFGLLEHTNDLADELTAYKDVFSVAEETPTQ